jgi:hypothetical protein
MWLDGCREGLRGDGFYLSSMRGDVEGSGSGSGVRL